MPRLALQAFTLALVRGLASSPGDGGENEQERGKRLKILDSLTKTLNYFIPLAVYDMHFI